MKKIAIIATGSRGDVQPYIALGKGLKEAGHSVRFVTPKNFESLVTAHGLDFYPVGVNVQDIAQSEVMRERLENGNFLTLMAQMAKEAEQGAIELAQAGLAACQGMDLLLAGMGGVYTGLALAEKLNLPLMQAYLLPFTPTRAFSSVLVPNMPAFLGRSFHRLSHHLTRQIIWQGFRSADQLSRRKALGIPAARFSGPYNSPRTWSLPILYGFSPSVIPAPPDWGEGVHVTGYWFLDSEEGWTPPSELVDFLQAGPAPVYIGFGSMSNRNPQETTDLVLRALKQVNQRAVLLTGWGGLQKGDLPDSIFMVDSVPHAWLFPQMAAVVHHGGAGTTAAGLRAGVPSLIVPYFGDQPFWGKRIADLGVGPVPIPRKNLSVERLARAIQEAVANQDMRQHAVSLGAQIRAEDGVGCAVKIIKELDPA